MGKEFGTTPSSLLHIDDPYTSWCIDDAVHAWGTYVESELRSAAEGAKDKKDSQRAVRRTWQRLFREDEEKAQPGGRFRDPAEMMG